MTGPLLIVGALVAGVVSAASPCVLPVLPGYLAAVSSVGPAVPGSRFRPSTAGALGFVVGFTAVFTALGATASALGGLLYARLDTAMKIAGGLLVVLGLNTLGVVRLGSLWREQRPISWEHVGRGPRRSLALGAVFAMGWTPCVGPILATILTKAAANSSLAEGMGLLLVYSAGLGLPFVGMAVWFERSAPMRRWLTRHGRSLQRVGGVVMIAVGVSYISGIWSTLFTGLQQWMARTGWPPI